MDSPAVTPGSMASSNDEKPRVKFLCSFLGSILPRPQDGKLRYVGGETRIVSVSRDIKYEELLIKMRELYEGVTVLKYQQPDEDLDALVSVVNDDDVVNMMEEYDKLGPGDGFTRLRIFLFGNSDTDGSLYFGDADEMEHERRYVDALNSLNESPDFGKLAGEIPGMGSMDDVRVAEQYFNQMNLEGSLHGHRNMDLPIAQMNLRHLTIPRVGLGQQQQPVPQRYTEIGTPWSPAHYSPRQTGNTDQRQINEFTTSPSSRYHAPHVDFSERSYERMPEEYNRLPMNTHSIYEPQPQYMENVVLIPTMSEVNENSCFPGNILQGQNVSEGNICEHCQMSFQRNKLYADSSWKPVEQPLVESPRLLPNPCAEYPPTKEMHLLNSVPSSHNDPRSVHPESHNHERGWISPHQSVPLVEEPRQHISVSGRLTDHYIVDNDMTLPLGHGNACDVHHMQSPYIHNEDQRYARPMVDYGPQVFQDQAIPIGSHMHLTSPEEHGVRYGNPSYAYGAGNYQTHNVHMPLQTQWRNVLIPVQVGSSYEPSSSPQLVSSSTSAGFIRGTVESSPKMRIGLENPNPWTETSKTVTGLEASLVPECFIAASGLDSRDSTDVTESAGVTENGVYDATEETKHGDGAENTGVYGIIDMKSGGLAHLTSILANAPEPVVPNGGSAKVDEPNASVPKELQDDQKLDFLPDLIASVKEATLQSLNEVKAKVQEDTALGNECNLAVKEIVRNGTELVEANVDLEVDSDYDNADNSKIEQTEAEAEAVDRGLQTIKNEDLEEIRELGSGTYGAVYHGKWKGSDVAIKRIKASCFAGRPSERQRLIADFWKEALILSSLHHPNVVSFYGVVRDGPDGSLATVTEFMVNGSLKQFLQKKDRTIDRRKRLMIAMDTAFGMEYLHGKNIVHFDLKCENLLVNMRDPHRPVCKIGDLGLSKVKQHTLVSGGVRGTLPWMAPELLSGKSNMVTEKIDVYSFGIVMWELLTGDEPYSDMHCASIIGGIVNNTLRPQIPMWCDPEWKSLMESCWASDPALRPSFTEVSQKLRNMAAAMNLK